MITTTLARIRQHRPCEAGWTRLLKYLGKTQADDERFPMSVILDSNGLDDCLWALRAEPQYAREWRLYAVRRARSVQHLTSDKRSVAAIDVAERYANGEATDDELSAAHDAADAARIAARSAADLGDAAESTAWSVAWSGADAGGAAKSAADAAESAAHATESASDAAESAAWSVAEIAADAAGGAVGAAESATWGAADEVYEVDEAEWDLRRVLDETPARPDDTAQEAGK